MSLERVKKAVAAYACGAIIIFGFVWGGMVLLAELAHASTRAPVSWVPGVYLILAGCAIVFAYVYALIKLIVLIARWADI